MPEVQTWIELLKVCGLPVSILLVVAWTLWPAYRDEVKFNKDMSRDTLTVLSSLTKVIQDKEDRDERGENTVKTELRELKAAINELTKTIREHIMRGA